MIPFKRIATGLSVATLAACCGAAVLFSVSGTGLKALTIPTGSMRPGMPPGSLVFVHRVPVTSLRVGDVITYTNPLHPKTTITHRIVKTYLIGGRVPGFVTKGDANKTADIPISGGTILGKVAWHVPYAGWWLMWAKQPAGLLVAIYLPAALLVAEEIQRLNAYYKWLKPYRLPGYAPRIKPKREGVWRLKGATAALIATLLVGGIAAPTALALLHSNTVTLGPNRLSFKPAHQCSGGSNNVNVTNTTNQTATTGSTTNSGNGSSGSSTSGNANNSNSTTITVTTC
ncbi:MAG TPA: signal peptidase I [Patescibacteria group bacterium]|nr:signal peptidase I [Patescibacteria group bacterium]